MESETLARAVALLDEGELVIVPTDTRYALAADALDTDALRRMFDALSRGADQPLTMCVAGLEDVGHVATATPLAHGLALTHWPGPTALVMRAKPWVPEEVTAGGETVAVRAPASDLLQRLARQFGPLALASLDATDAETARKLAGTHARLVLDGGVTPGGRHAVIDARGKEPVVLRTAAP